MGNSDPQQTQLDQAELDELGQQFATWEQDVVKVLARSSKKDPADLPTDAWRTLIHTTAEGLEVRPLYTRLDELPEQPAPGAFPFVRGGSPVGRPDSGWFVTEQFTTEQATGAPAGADPAAALNDAVLSALEQGTSALWLHVPAAQLSPILKGVYLDLAPLLVDVPAADATIPAAVWDLCDAADGAGQLSGPRSDIALRFAVAPLTEALTAGASSADTSAAIAIATEAAARSESVRSLLADGSAAHELGATDAQELGIALAAAVDYVRAAEAAGMPVAAALGQIWFRLAATPDQFGTMAKMRAARQLFARVAQVLDHPDAGDAPQHAVTSLAAMTRRDPYVNMLRTTVAAFAAGIGGATYVTVRPFDATLPGGLASASRSFVRRMARNTQLLLLEESHLGHVVDPAGGSWYVEARTAELARLAWDYFQQLEAAGGLGATLETVLADLARSRENRDGAVAKRTQPLTGLSEFPNLAEAALPASQRGLDRYSYGAAFEALRDRSDAFLDAHGVRPHVALAGLGLPAERSARTTFAANLLAAGGIELVDLEVSAPDEYAAALTAHMSSAAGTAQASTIVLLCGTDKRYADNGGQAVAALRDAGAHSVLVAGAAKAFGDVGEAETADSYLTIGIDAVAALSGVAEQLGVK